MFKPNFNSNKKLNQSNMNTIKQLKTILVLVALCLLGINKASAAEPNWTVNPPSFQYNMTMLAVVNIDCAELLSPSNRIGVFKGSECRGTALTSQVVNGKYLASLFIYSNSTKGDTLTFKIYNVANDSVYDAKVTVLFQQNAAYGTASSPFVVYGKYPCYFTKDVLPASNFISPNADGKNDVFWIDDVDSYKDFALTVYNEFGLEVYKIAREYKNDWAATYDGKTLPTGAYYYTFKNDATGKEYKGILNVVKPN